MSLTGSVAAINAALNGLIDTPTSDFQGAAVLSVTANDTLHTIDPINNPLIDSE
jgi:hypothetical protein